jgi:polysaccharide biosynthesis/export protein
MGAGQTGKDWRPRPSAWLGLLMILTAGCTTQRPWVDRALQADSLPPGASRAQAKEYLIGCPDVLEIKLSSPRQSTSRQEVGPDGRIAAPNGERVRVEGLSPAAVAQSLARTAKLDRESVTIKVVEYRSQQLYLVGQAVGPPRAIPYKGPETVLAFLERSESVTSGAAPDEVYIIRARIAEAGRPEVYHVRLRDILTRHDESTNLQLQPQDQVYVGESQRARLARYIPPWFKPLFDSIWGMARPEAPVVAAK